jgi:hypothetical protein
MYVMLFILISKFSGISLNFVPKAAHFILVLALSGLAIILIMFQKKEFQFRIVGYVSKFAKLVRIGQQFRSRSV